MEANKALQDVTWALLEESDLDDSTQLLVAAAVESEASFAGHWDGTASLTRPPSEAEPLEPAGAYLTGVSVEGFRGVGSRVTLPLQVGPGLTVVTGRNGSGKSSFAEAIELALTGRYSRAEDRPAGWRRDRQPPGGSG